MQRLFYNCAMDDLARTSSSETRNSPAGTSEAQDAVHARRRNLPAERAACRLAAGAFALVLAGCASTPRPERPPANGYCVSGYGCYRVLASAAGYQASGIASWYGTGDAGRPTASGVPFDPQAMRIANKTLPFGTWVQIRNLRNGREAVAMVDDRGPFVDGRLLDATPAVAHQLGYYLAGTAPVRVTAVPLAELSEAQRQAARADEQSAVEYAHRHPHEILAEAGHVAIRGVVDITTTGLEIGVGVLRAGLDVTFGILKFLF